MIHDDLDGLILKILSDHPVTAHYVAAELWSQGIKVQSVEAVRRRLEKMEEDGLICSYATEDIGWIWGVKRENES